MFFENDFSIKEINAGKYIFTAEPSVPVSGRVFCSLSFRLSGRVHIRGKRQTYEVTPDSIFYMPCGYDYTTTVPENGKAYVVHFWAEGDFPKEPFLWKPEDSQGYGHLFSQLVALFPLGCRQDFSTIGRFYQLLAQIRADSQPAQQVLPRRMQKTKESIHQKFNDAELSVGMLAEEADLSATYFRREFKQYFGCQPIVYIRNIRLEHAKALLEAGECSVSEVAIRSGYENVSYFSYDFRRMTGQSPSQYRGNATKTQNPE